MSAGLPGISDEDSIRGLESAGGALSWLSVERVARKPGEPRTQVFARSGNNWILRHSTDGGGEVLGFGTWPGGAKLLATDTAPQLVHVVDGVPSAEPPRLPSPDSVLIDEVHFRESGWAFASGMLMEPSEHFGRGIPVGFALMRWSPQSPVPVVTRFMKSSSVGATAFDRARIVIRDEREVYAVANGFVGTTRFTEVRRFDGDEWVLSASLPDSFSHGLVLGRDGAVWLATRDGHEIWRRAPGPGDHWQQIAADSFNVNGQLRVEGILAVGDRDLLTIARFEDRGYGLYRVRVGAPR